MTQVQTPDLGTQAVLDQVLADYQVLSMDLKAVNAQVRSSGGLSILLGAERVDLRLEKNDLRTPEFRSVVTSKDGDVEVDPGPVVTYKGEVIGSKGSHVRVTVTDDMLTATLFLEDDTYYIDALSDFMGGNPASKLRHDKSLTSNRVVVYRERDVRPGEAGTCATEGHTHGKTPIGTRARLLGDIGGAEPDALQFRTLEVATECDGQYFQRFGNSGARNRIEGILNAVEGIIYEDELDLGINHVFQSCWNSVPNDPYTSLNASTTLNQMRRWWNRNRRNVSRDVAHQFSGKDFSGGTIGIAFVGVICRSPGAAYGISQDFGNSRARRRLTAHEIGHNLSANHDSRNGCNGNGPVMCPSIQSGSSSAADNFSSQSRQTILNYISSVGGCI